MTKLLIVLFALTGLTAHADDQYDRLIELQRQQLLIQSLRNASDAWNGQPSYQNNPRRSYECRTKAIRNIYGDIELVTECE